MVRPRDRLGVGPGPWTSPEVPADPEDDWYASPAGEAYFGRDIPAPAEPRTWTPYPKRDEPMGRVGMGYKRQRKIFKLVFEDPDMEGLVVRCRSTSVRQFLDIQTMAQNAKGEGSDELAGVKALLATFATVIIDWNMEDDDDTPIAPTAETLLDEDFDFVMVMVNAWIEAMAGVAKDLGKASTPTSPPPAESMLLEIPSTPLLSSSVPA